MEVRRLLGIVDPARSPTVVRDGTRRRRRLVSLEVEDGIEIGLTILRPDRDVPGAPLVLGIASCGAAHLQGIRGRLVRSLLRLGACVCLADLRGTGLTLGGDEFRGRHARSTAISSSALMLGEPVLGQQLRDLRCALQFLRSEPGSTSRTVVLWGDSAAEPNGPGDQVEVPFNSGPGPELSEPAGTLLALLGALFEGDVRAVYAAGGLVSLRSMLESPFVLVPHDTVVPGLLRVADISDVVSALAPSDVRLEAFVDGRNRPISRSNLQDEFRESGELLRAGGGTLIARAGRGGPDRVARWMLGAGA